MRPRLYAAAAYWPRWAFYVVRLLAKMLPAHEAPADQARRILGEMRRMNGAALDPRDVEFVKQMCGEKS